MKSKITDLSLGIYLAVCGFFRDLKKDERGLSGVVVAILLILVAVLAVVLIWGFLGRWLAELWDSITKKGSEL